MAEDKVRRGEVGSGCVYQNEDTTKGQDGKGGVMIRSKHYSSERILTKQTETT